MARYRREFAGEHRNASMTLQLTPAEKTDLQKAAEQQGTTLSEYSRELLLRRSATVIAASPRNPEIKALLRELNAIGNNLNQIARELNTTGNLHNPDELRDALTWHKHAIEKALNL